MKCLSHRVKEDRSTLRTIRQSKANWIGRILRTNCLLKHVLEGKLKGKRRRGKKHHKLLADLKETRLMVAELEGRSTR